MALARQIPRPFDVVVVAETRAIGRRDRVFWRWVWELQDLGISVAVVDKDIDNTTEDGEAAMREEANYAFKEYVRIRNRLRKAGMSGVSPATDTALRTREGRENRDWLSTCMRTIVDATALMSTTCSTQPAD
jgi:DNA invertase Pin-like site-specific DNA recombinase